MSLFKKKNQKKENSKKSSELVEFLMLENSNDETLLKVADNLKNHVPYIINFEKIEVDEINKAIAFFSGITYALEGEVILIREKVIMFGDNDAFSDGTLKIFVKELT